MLYSSQHAPEDPVTATACQARMLAAGTPGSCTAPVDGSRAKMIGTGRNQSVLLQPTRVGAQHPLLARNRASADALWGVRSGFLELFAGTTCRPSGGQSVRGFGASTMQTRSSVSWAHHSFTSDTRSDGQCASPPPRGNSSDTTLEFPARLFSRGPELSN